MFNRPISLLVVLQLFAILLGHAAGVLGEACYRKANPGGSCPQITAFYAHSGLWLLLVPIAWFVAFIIQQSSAKQESQLALWVATGAILLAAFGLAGMAVFLSALPIPLLH